METGKSSDHQPPAFEKPAPTTVSTVVARRSIEVKDLFSRRPLLTLVRGGERDLAGVR